MKIEHCAIWARDIETLKNFYEKYFDAHANEKYSNPLKHFFSYFLSFEGNTRLEIMQKKSVNQSFQKSDEEYLGMAHMAFSVGNKDKVDSITKKLKNDGFTVLSGPRTTGDGYYESLVLDPEGNRIEITI